MPDGVRFFSDGAFQLIRWESAVAVFDDVIT